MADAVWQQLSITCSRAAEVAVFLGENARAKQFNEPAPQNSCPVHSPARRVFPDGDVFLNTENDQHALCQVPSDPRRGPLESFPVFRYWQFENLTEGSAW